MPTFITIFGMRFYFYSSEHLPIHVHVENSDGRAKIQVAPLILLIDNNGIKRKDIKKALSVVRLYKKDIIQKWNEYFTE